MDYEWRKDKRKRAAASKHLKVVQERVLARDASLEDLQEAARKMVRTRGGVPTVWSDGATGQMMRGRNVERVGAADVKKYTRQFATTCADCVHFDIKNGRAEIIRQDFATRLVLEQEWALRHLGADLDHLGLCGQSNGELATLSLCPACDNFTPRKGRI